MNLLWTGWDGVSGSRVEGDRAVRATGGATDSNARINSKLNKREGFIGFISFQKQNECGSRMRVGPAAGVYESL